MPNFSSNYNWALWFDLHHPFSFRSYFLINRIIKCKILIAKPKVTLNSNFVE